MKELHNITFDNNIKICSFDIESIYTNIIMQEANNTLIFLGVNSDDFQHKLR
jgi:hypothetical protein